MYRFLQLTSVMTLVITLSGCGFFAPPPRLYLLEPVIDERSQRTPTAVKDLGIAVVKLPEYADNESISTRAADGRVVQSTRSKWAESPDEAITRVLANRIQAFTGGNVIIEPWPRGFEPGARAEVDFHKLLRDEEGGVEVSGQLRLISGDGDEVLAIENFQLFRRSGGKKSEDFFDAMALVINDIARIVTSTLLAMEAPN